jgi:murein DD-endopeptidase MepM/ murein hydrolase activator NlpD
MDDFTGGGTYRAVLLDSRERRLGRAPFFTFTHDPQGREVKAALLAIPSTAKAEKMIIRIEGSNGVFIEELSLLVEGRDYAAEVIELDQRNTEIRTVPDPQKTAESEQLWAVISRTGSALYAQAPFLPPVTSTRRTSFFGDRRVYHYVNGSTDTSVHAGVDYGVPTGTEVRACAPGKVVLARSRIVTGNSIAVEHLPGVYSLYYHLDEIKISEGDLVEEGALLGLSGSTGLATGPHLHWEIRVAGENTDPDAFTARPVLDKDEILSKLSSGSF